MPLQDITIDTNVFMHASNPTEGRFAASKDFLQQLLRVETSLAIDEGFDTDRGKNRSHIGHEYLTHLVAGTLGYTVVSHLAQTGRIRAVPHHLPAAVSKLVNRMVSDSADRRFLRVAINSLHKTLVSHDFGDFSMPKRKSIKSEFGVDMLEAGDAVALLS